MRMKELSKMKEVINKTTRQKEILQLLQVNPMFNRMKETEKVIRKKLRGRISPILRTKIKKNNPLLKN